MVIFFHDNIIVIIKRSNYIAHSPYFTIKKWEWQGRGVVAHQVKEHRAEFQGCLYSTY